MKKVVAIALMVTLGLAMLAGCGGNNASNGGSQSSSTSTSTDSSANNSTSGTSTSETPSTESPTTGAPTTGTPATFTFAGSMDQVFSLYGVNPESTSRTPMSSDRMPMAQLNAAYETISNMPGAKYEDLIVVIGVDPSDYQLSGGDRTFYWRSSEDESKYLYVYFTLRDGEWSKGGSGSNNL